MFHLDPTFQTLLFCAGIGATYLLVRANLVRTASVVVLGSLVNSFFFFLFAIARGNSLLQAGFSGFALGILFTGLAVVVATHFRHVEAQAGQPVTSGLPARATVSFRAGR